MQGRMIGKMVQWLTVFFYNDDGLLAFTMPDRIHVDMDVPMGLFDRVGLDTNILKTVGVVCQPLYIVDRNLEEVYTWWMTVVGPSFW